MNIDLIKEAVVAWDGKFKPACDFVVIYNDGGNYAACSTPELTHEPILFTRAKFEEVASRMGYINGYKWGVEYPTNGKKPDLPNDVIVEVKTIERDTLEGFSAICVWFWDEVCSFRIIDPRYKPELEDGPVEPEPEEVPEESAAAFFAKRSPTVYGAREPLPDAKPVEPEPKSWYEACERPPVGATVEFYWCGGYQGVVEICGYRESNVIYWRFDNDSVDCAEMQNSSFKPFRTERERTIAAADAVIRKTSSAVDDVAINALYDAGLLRLPDNKNKD